MIKSAYDEVLMPVHEDVSTSVTSAAQPTENASRAVNKNVKIFFITMKMNDELSY